jgi:uncharacterized protein involved in exopolysaccharide biosynthesis
VNLSWALRDHWILFALPIVLLVGAAVAMSLARTPTYTAETELIAGDIDAAPPEALPGYTDAANNLAETYSRTIRDDEVVRPVARKMGTSPARVRAGLSAASVPESSIFRVIGTAESAGEALRISTLASQVFASNVQEGGRKEPRSEALLERYREAELEVTRAEARAKHIDDELAVTLSDSLREERRQARGDLAAAQVRADGLREKYLARSHAGATGAEIVERASGAASDRATVLQSQVFIAALGGIVVGLALALFRANSLARYRYSLSDRSGSWTAASEH